MSTLFLFAAGCAPTVPSAPDPANTTPAPDGTQPTVPPVTTTPSPTTPDDAIVVGGLVFHGSLPTNLLVVSVDTTRRDYLSFYSGTGLTPNLDAVLSESYVLSDHRSCSNWTGPSMTCIVSGKTPGESGFWPGNGLPQPGFGPTAKLLGDIADPLGSVSQRPPCPVLGHVPQLDQASGSVSSQSIAGGTPSPS